MEKLLLAVVNLSKKKKKKKSVARLNSQDKYTFFGNKMILFCICNQLSTKTIDNEGRVCL